MVLFTLQSNSTSGMASHDLRENVKWINSLLQNIDVLCEVTSDQTRPLKITRRDNKIAHITFTSANAQAQIHTMRDIYTWYNRSTKNNLQKKFDSLLTLFL